MNRLIFALSLFAISACAIPVRVVSEEPQAPHRMLAVAANRAYSHVNELNQVSVGPGAQTAANVAGVMTGVVVLTGDRILASGAISSLSFQRKWTGTPTGTFSYEGSNDPDPDATPIGGWVAVTPDTAGANPAGGASGSTTVFKNPPMRWYHEIYTNSGGAGVLVSIAEGKGA